MRAYSQQGEACHNQLRILQCSAQAKQLESALSERSLTIQCQCAQPVDVPDVQAKKNMQIAGLYFLHCNTYHIAPKPTQLEIAEYPENALFRRLESMQPREKPLQLEPGQILLAVYGDNW